ncbi:AAA family ATPase [Sulfitobacter sp. R18_1]|uniref:AAA family ATPase n=1 Tax=Sulfitobacter sp. R18_1 TaxID=2821104 RepID=UPI001AD9E09A|nr:AAA family ATPase [Sulfitobacter sp. R18_1]MBO9428499.1 AAA family ATPase [Sulfitobacter sp. R18_1]
MAPLTIQSRRFSPAQRAAPSQNDPLNALEARLLDMQREIDKAEGRRETLSDRLGKLIDEVGRAKGRLLLKPDADAFLEGLQADLHRKAVGSYERLLTAIAQDVLRGEDSIGLDLYTDRGLPALDIFIDSNGNREDIINGAGGSMTNIISLGLRMIATVRAGMRKFVALDEPDCWLSPDKVHRFYHVIGDLGEKLGVQSLIISHHDLKLMPEEFSVAKFTRDGDRVICTNDPKADNWEIDQPGIRRLRMINFMSHEDTTVRLAPGATAIIGDNHLGKSVAVRSLRALAYGEISDADIKHGAKKVEVEVEIENQRVVRLTRQPGRNPVNEWTLETLDGQVFKDEEAGVEYRTGGRSVPEWVGKMLGIERFEGLEHQLSHQKFPTFLLGETPSKRASVLSIGRESGVVQKMISHQRQRSKSDSTLVKKGEQEVAQIQEQIEALEDFKALGEEISNLKSQARSLEERKAKTAQLKALIEKYEDADAKLSKVLPTSKVLEGFNVEIPDISEGTDKRRAITELGKSFVDADRKIDAAQAQCSILADALPKVPEISDMKEMSELISKLAEADPKLARANQEADKISEDLKSNKVSIDEMISELGGVCPLCNSAIKHSHDIV